MIGTCRTSTQVASAGDPKALDRGVSSGGLKHRDMDLGHPDGGGRVHLRGRPWKRDGRGGALSASNGPLQGRIGPIVPRG